ncbi:unnamed protein product [Rotaria magnacalcarata]|uniref:Uncharacterized protein n=2 Tax=Rotaria magnacalcarata TaxID=392030 RepID=A0A816BTU8_9BILA|nr:unnamed protein product [Rotaria magnacalcarata]CAF4095643.1 unnamed protein product [Rotaria magnacalcarata]
MNQLDIAQQYLNDIRSGFINQFKEKIDLTNQYTGPFACIECRLMIAFISCKELLLSLIYTDLMALPGTTPTLSEDVVPKYSRPQSKRKSNNMRQIIEFNRYIKYAIEGLANDFLRTNSAGILWLKFNKGYDGNTEEEQSISLVEYFTGTAPTLELNINVYDTSGLLFHDQSILKDANECHLMIRAALRDLENAKQDITTLFNGADVTLGQKNELTVDKYHEIIPGERLKPYQILYSTIGLAINLSKIDNDATIENFNHECDTFGICSIIELSLLLEYAAEMTEQACQRIVKFTLKTEVK